MRKRYAIPVVLLLAALAAGVAYLGRPDPPGPGVTWANASRIEVGMTEPEVVAIVGGQPMIFPPDTAAPLQRPGTDTDTRMVWSGTECEIIVYLDWSGHVDDKETKGPSPPTWFDRARRRLGL